LVPITTAAVAPSPQPVPWGRILGGSTRRFLDLGSLRLRGEWSRTNASTNTIAVGPSFGGSSFGGFAGGAENKQNVHSTFNFYATLPTENGKWSLRFFAKNFTNSMYLQYKASMTYSGEGDGGYPPLLGVDLTYRF
jgi:hypothetical protein